LVDFSIAVIRTRWKASSMEMPLASATDRSQPRALLDTRVRHIDGLRAVAILSVVFFHAGLPGFASGFVGVDIFFVISGFLIINQIVTAVRAGKFSVWEFYARRSLRILPLLLTVLVVSLGLSAVILVSPYEWEWFGLSGGLAAIFLSNHYFLSKQDYFDIDMFEKSLLHTWSLSVEEQFYLFVPLIILGVFVLAARFKLAAGRLLAGAALMIFVASLIGCIQLTSSTGKNVAFYVALWRAWEFVAGGAIGFFATSDRLNRMPGFIWDALAFFGFAVLVVAVGFGVDGGFYPGTSVLLPVSGAVLLILSGLVRPDTVVARVLSWPPLVGIGLISYGWYLWHWPLLSLARIADFGDPDQTRDLVMVGLSFGLAVGTYFILERPVMDWRRRCDLRALAPRIVGTGVASCIAVMVLIAIVAGAANLSGKHSLAIAGDPQLLSARAEPCATADCVSASNTFGFLAGDSHADRLRDTLQREAALIGVKVLWPFKFSCPEAAPEAAQSPPVLACPGIRARIKEVAGGGRRLGFFVDFRRWNGKLGEYERLHGDGAYQRKLAREFAAFTAGGSRRLLVIGPVPEFQYEAVACVLRADRYGMARDFCSLPRARVEARRKKTMEILRRVTVGFSNIRLVDPIDLFCDRTTCRPYVGKSILYKDTNHLSRFGSDWFFDALRKNFLWAFAGVALGGGDRRGADTR
jgi:peptidoglycan/LPS O-acetylase OafA/YrhL